MSAYLCDAPTLAAIAREAAKIAGQSDAEAEGVFSMLLDENLKSIGYRYPDAARIVDWYDEGEAAFIWERIPEQTYSAAQIDEMIRSYQYQSCEHPEWAESFAKQLTDALKLALAPRLAEEAKAKAAELAARRAAWSALPCLYPKETAAVIRKLLKANFPAVKFSVKTSRGSMCSSVDIRWTDGPTVAAVQAFVSCFKAGNFDGMDDSYRYDTDHVLTIDGQIFRPACQYVFCERRTSAMLARKAAALVASYYGLEAPTITERGDYWSVENDTRHIAGSNYYWSDLIHQAAEDRSRFAVEG